MLKKAGRRFATRVLTIPLCRTRWQDEVQRMLPGVKQRDHDYKYFGRIQPTVKYLQLNSADAEET